MVAPGIVCEWCGLTATFLLRLLACPYYLASPGACCSLASTSGVSSRLRLPGPRGPSCYRFVYWILLLTTASNSLKRSPQYTRTFHPHSRKRICCM